MNYQKLFNYLAEQHGVTLLETDMQEIVNIVKEAEPPKSEWISVKDRLPQYKEGEWQTVVVSGIDEGKRYVYYAEVHAYGKKETAQEIFSVPGWCDMNVTHWMPWPEPPLPDKPL